MNKLITIILAGGKSSRMGENKALMTIGGTRLIDKLISEFAPLSEKVIVIAGDRELFKKAAVLVIEDDESVRGQGPLSGLYTGLKAAGEGPCLVVACDMPFASAELASRMLAAAEKSGKEAIVPIAGGRIHPLFAVYRAEIAEKVKTALLAEERSVKKLLSGLDAEKLPADEWEKALWNMNTPEEYREARKMEEEAAQ